MPCRHTSRALGSARPISRLIGRRVRLMDPRPDTARAHPPVMKWTACAYLRELASAGRVPRKFGGFALLCNVRGLESANVIGAATKLG